MLSRERLGFKTIRKVSIMRCDTSGTSSIPSSSHNDSCIIIYRVQE